MRKPKSKRHVNAAKARWRAAEASADAERAAGIDDRPAHVELREPFELDLRTWGGPHLHIEPRLLHIAAIARDPATGVVVRVASIKEMLHWIADKMPSRRGIRGAEASVHQAYSAQDEADAAAADAEMTTLSMRSAMG